MVDVKNSGYGRKWITNGKQNHKWDPNTPMPTNFRIGRVQKTFPKPTGIATFNCTCIVCGTTFVHKTYSRLTCSKVCLEQRKRESIRTNPISNHSGGFRGTHITYNEVHLHSTYELRFAISLDDCNIKWVRPKSIQYVEDDIVRRYTPDFYIPHLDIYVDTKNDYLIKLQSTKLQRIAKQCSITLVILDKNHLTYQGLLEVVSLHGIEPRQYKGVNLVPSHLAPETC